MRVSENVGVMSGPAVASRSLKRTRQVSYQEIPVGGTAGVSRLNPSPNLEAKVGIVRRLDPNSSATESRSNRATRAPKLNSLPNARRIRRSCTRKFAG